MSLNSHTRVGAGPCVASCACRLAAGAHTHMHTHMRTHTEQTSTPPGHLCTLNTCARVHGIAQPQVTRAHEVRDRHVCSAPSSRRVGRVTHSPCAQGSPLPKARSLRPDFSPGSQVGKALPAPPSGSPWPAHPGGAAWFLSRGPSNAKPRHLMWKGGSWEQWPPVQSG